MVEFDYQWKHLPSKNIEYNQERVKELLSFTGLEKSFFQGKKCLDCGCGNGRYTYALLQLGASHVDSFDVSERAVEACRKINDNAYVGDLMRLEPTKAYGFVLCWGVLHHTSDPRVAFNKVSAQVTPNGILHVMLYHKDTQGIYKKHRQKWKTLTEEERVNYVRRLAEERGGDAHGWYDALNPEYNWSFSEKEIICWFKEEDFANIRLITKHNINVNGVKQQ
ncbi:MAG: class I SAM-dependent methyltransferase [Thaumarchaeota archaeon]|nr:class I SAM-dependent methyltransferase [Nitrososphaerota archaeon]